MGRKEWYLSPVSLPEDDDKHEMKQRNHPPGSYSSRKGSPLLDTCHKLRITGQRKTQAATVLDVFFSLPNMSIGFMENGIFTYMKIPISINPSFRYK